MNRLDTCSTWTELGLNTVMVFAGRNELVGVSPF